MKKIVIADDQVISIKGFELCCKLVNPLALTLQCHSMETLYTLLKNESDISLLIMNIFIENTNTLHHIQTLKKLHPGLSVLIAGYGKDIVFGVRAIREGADGYLNKKATDPDILEAIRKTLNKGRYFSNEIIATYTEMFNAVNGVSNPFDKLSEREFNVMLYLINGLETNEIAHLMSLQSTTISTYKSRIFEKLNLQRLNELKLMAELYGIETWFKNGYNV